MKTEKKKCLTEFLKFYTNISDKMTYTDSADPGSDQGVHCLPFHQVVCQANVRKIKFRQKKKRME